MLGKLQQQGLIVRARHLGI
ncbi:hypothetical protein QUA54_28005 [Microcoleus sp. MOSTC5]|nr:hypothetical protein [Microcoleus asticus]